MLSKWLLKSAECPPVRPNLPDPRAAESKEDALIVASANNEIAKTPPSAGVKRKRGEYKSYTSEQRAKMARYAVDNGVMNAARKFSVNESTIRNLKKQFINIKVKSGEEPTEMEKKDRGKPLMLGKLDEDVQTYVRYLRRMGGVVNVPILLGAARGIIKNKDRQLLYEYGGSIELSKSWAQSFLKRLGYVKRKGTKAARKVPDDFDEIRMEFLSEVQNIVKNHDIPDDLIINFDQTNVYVVPAGDYTLEESGSKQVQIIGLEDKRQVTVLLGSSLSGHLLPPQIIYQGKTDMCHPKFKFPSDWNITHSENHWSNTTTMIEYAEKVLIPYVEGVREQLPLCKSDQPAVCMFDVFRAHQSEDFQHILWENGIKVRFVPASCTSDLQPLDLSGNDEYKKHVKAKFQQWYADQIDNELKNGKQLDEIKIDLKLSTLKPIHAGWLVSAAQSVMKSSLIMGWNKAGIKDAIDKIRD